MSSGWVIELSMEHNVEVNCLLFYTPTEQAAESLNGLVDVVQFLAGDGLQAKG